MASVLYPIFSHIRLASIHRQDSHQDAWIMSQYTREEQPPSIVRYGLDESNSKIEGVPKLFALAKNLAINKKSTILMQSS